jgi:hypothetical protein
MPSADPFTAWGDLGPGDDCCAFIVENGHSEPCGDACELGSPYCPRHHALTHLARGSLAEAAQIRRIDVIALLAGARIGRAGAPFAGEIEGLERRQVAAVIAFDARRRPR